MRVQGGLLGLLGILKKGNKIPAVTEIWVLMGGLYSAGLGLN